MNRIQDLVAPRCCAGCSRPGPILCPDCAAGCLRLPVPAPLTSGGCHVSAAFVFEGHLRRLLHQAKYRDGRSLLLALGILAGGRLDPPGVSEELLAIPLGRRRHRERGYNQAEILARLWSRDWRLPVVQGLRRRRDTRPQVGTDATVRRANVAGCFAWTGAALVGRRLILVDDVVTTGATTEAAAATLLAAGAGRVRVVALARVR